MYGIHVRRQKNFTLIMLIFFFYIQAAPPKTLLGWDLVFQDEFEGKTLDTKKWNPTYNWGHSHNHQAWCVAKNVFVQDGKLRIKGEAKRHPDAPKTVKSGGQTYSLDYTSGAIDTRKKFSLQYGYIEGRFKAPRQKGTWPAFWALQDGWPPEIDILEIPHDRTKHHYYLHYTQPDWYDSHGSAWDHEASFGGVHTGPDKSAGFHTYGVEWDANYMNFYFDDKRIASYERYREISQTRAMYIIVNLAIGGWATSGGGPIEVTSNSPAWFECDWIRVYKRKDSFNKPLRIQSVASGKCMISNTKSVILGERSNSLAYARFKPLNTTVFRLYFGDKVLEVPNESKEAGAAAGLWGWNGKDHQRIVIEPQTGFKETVVRMKMKHSGLYLRNDNDRVIQDWNTAWPWNQNWRIVTENDNTKTSVDPNISSNQFSQNFKIDIHGSSVSIVRGFGAEDKKITLLITDIRGKIIRSYTKEDSIILRKRDFAAGIYITKLLCNEQIVCRRFIVY